MDRPYVLYLDCDVRRLADLLNLYGDSVESELTSLLESAVESRIEDLTTCEQCGDTCEDGTGDFGMCDDCEQRYLDT